MPKHKTSRRGFLKKSAAGIGALTAPTIITSAALGNATTPPASERITIGHIGVGGRGGGTHVRGFVQHADAQIVAVCDPYRKKRENWARYVDEAYAKKNGKGSYKSCDMINDFRELVAREDIDAVVIATTDHWHVLTALAAARAGKDLYVEKPLGLSINQNKALREAINRYGVVFQYGTQQRSSRNCRFGCELVRNGRVGKIHTIEVVAPGGAEGGSPTPTPVPDGLDYDLYIGPSPMVPHTKNRCTTQGSWFIYNFALGFLAGWGAHPLDIAQWGNGSDHTSPVEYEGTGFIPSKGLYDTVKTWDVRARYADGVQMTFTHGPDSTKFIGSDGWVRVWRQGIDAEPKSLLRSVIAPNEIHLIESLNQGRNFLDCVKSRAETINPIESAIRSDAISHLSDIAIRTGRKIHWDPKKEEIIGDPSASRFLDRPMRGAWRL